MSEALAALEQRRNEAREKALDDPRQARLRELTDEIVKAKNRRQNPLQFKALTDERDELYREINAEADALGAEVRAARAAKIVAEKAAVAAEAEGLADEDIEIRLAKIADARRSLKAEQRALLAVKNKRDRLKGMRELLAKLPPDLREAAVDELLG